MLFLFCILLLLVLFLVMLVVVRLELMVVIFWCVETIWLCVGVVDFVLCDYIDDVVVVYDHVCCCCVLIIHGDNLVCRKHMVVCYAAWPIGVSGEDVVLGVYSVCLLLLLLLLVLVVRIVFMVICGGD